MLIKSRRNEIIDGLRDLPEKIKQVLALDDKVQQISEELYQKRSLLIMGRGFNFATCLEGALKVKELTFMHSGQALSLSLSLISTASLSLFQRESRLGN